MISVRKHRPHPDRVFCRLTEEKLVIKIYRVMEGRVEKQRGDLVESDVGVWDEGRQGWNATVVSLESKIGYMRFRPKNSGHIRGIEPRPLTIILWIFYLIGLQVDLVAATGITSLHQVA